MKQYLQLLRDIKEKGTLKPPAREGMPSTISLFGYQFRHNMQDGFPLLTTKKMFWKGIVIELLWFLKGDTNIKYLVDNGVNIWNEDAYNYYCKIFKKSVIKNKQYDDELLTFEGFIEAVKFKREFHLDNLKPNINNYEWGDCGFQYGKVWRDWDGLIEINNEGEGHLFPKFKAHIGVDQIKILINNLKNNPEGRRHIVTSIDPAHDQDLALYWCHCLMQFNCRPLTIEQRCHLAVNTAKMHRNEIMFGDEEIGLDKSLEEQLNENNIPKYYLDLQWYQRSADVFLGVPFNIASYGLLLEIIAKMCNMVSGELISTYGDVHIYENHLEQVEEQLKREPLPLPKLILFPTISNNEIHNKKSDEINAFLDYISIPHYAMNDFVLVNYTSHPAIKAELKTGLK